jgi:TetR/AcrR family transcriptional regulator, cholesterol catabolism regulator
MQEIKTKEKMLHIARTLFWKNGYHATSMRDLAREYGCKPANIYNFFSNKEEILYAVLLEEMEQIIEPIKHLEEDENTDPIKQLHIIIESHLKVTLSYRRSAKTLFDVTLDSLTPQKRKEIVSLRDTYDRIIRKVIQRGIDSGLFLGTDAKLASFMIASMITRTRIWFHPKKGVSAAELAEFIFQFSLNGLKGEQPSQTDKDISKG